VYEVPQNVAQALFGRDALAKGIYSKLFDYIVSTINQTMGMQGIPFSTEAKNCRRQI
jgi:myosin-1